MPFSWQSILGVVALLAGLYAGYDLLFATRHWNRDLAGVVARAWVFVLLVTIGLDQMLFGQNAVLQIGYVFGLPLLAVQIGFVISLLVATFIWSGR